MKIVFIAHYAGSPNHGMVYGHYFLAREWVKVGHQVTIVAASFAHARLQQPEIDGSVTEEFIDGIRYLWVKSPEYQPSRKIGRVINILSFTIKALVGRLPIDQADLVISSSHYPFAILPARKVAKRFGAKLVFEVRDIWPLTLVELSGVSAHHPFIYAMQWAEDYAYRVADKVVSVLPKADRHMIAHGMAPDKFVYVPNGADLNDQSVEPLKDEHLEIIHKLKADGNFLVGYAGRMGLANAMHSLIDALAELKDEGVHALLLGDGYELENLRHQAEVLSLSERVHFLPSVPKAQVGSFLSEMDVLYVGLLKKGLYRFGTSLTKLNDYMLVAKPVICSIDGDVEAISEAGAGFLCRPEDPRDIADKISKMMSIGLDGRQDMGTSGREWVLEHRDYKVLAERFLAEVDGSMLFDGNSGIMCD